MSQSVFAIALSPPVRKQAMKISLLVGSLLAVINYGDKIVADTMLNSEWLKLATTYLVPYLVSSYAAASNIKKHQNAA